MHVSAAMQDDNLTHTCLLFCRMQEVVACIHLTQSIMLFRSNGSPSIHSVIVTTHKAQCCDEDKTCTVCKHCQIPLFPETAHLLVAHCAVAILVDCQTKLVLPFCYSATKVLEAAT